VAEARAISTETLAAGTTLFELAGSQATLAEHNLDRHWRNARVHTLHDPVRWKYHASATTTSTRSRRAGDHLMAKQILLNAFNMNCIGHQPRPVDPPADTSTQYKTLVLDQPGPPAGARAVRRAVHRRHRRRLRRLRPVAGRDAQGVDPAGQRPAAAGLGHGAVTRHLGFGLTANLTYEAPYLFARRIPPSIT
jgi:hypothetical protein